MDATIMFRTLQVLITVFHVTSGAFQREDHQWWHELKLELDTNNVCGGYVDVLGICSNSTEQPTAPPWDEENFYDDDEITPVQKLCSCDDTCERYGDCCMNYGSRKVLDTNMWKCQVLPGSITGQTFYLHGMCSGSWMGNPDVTRLCEDDVQESEVEGKNLTILYHMPAYSKHTRTLYKNVFCAKCNYDTKDLLQWNLDIRCNGLRVLPEANDSVIGVSYTANNSTWNIHTVNNETCTLYVREFFASSEKIQSNFNTKKCIKSINSCPDTAPGSIKEKCNGYTLYVVQLRAGIFCRTQTVYKNYHCALCNGVDADQINCSDKSETCSKPHGQPPKGSVWLGIIMDFNFAEGDDMTGAHGPCEVGQLHDPVTNRCYTVTKCGGRYKVIGDECVPIDKSELPENISNYTFSGVDCKLRISLSQREFSVLPNNSIFVTDTKRTFEIGRFEVIRTSDDGNWTQIEVCADDFFFKTINFTPPQHLLTEINLIISIICLALHLLVYIIVPKLRNLPGKVLMCLAASLLAADSLFLIGGKLIEPFTITCAVFGAFKHFSYLATFFWMNVMAFDISRTFRSSKPRSSDHMKTFVRYSLYAWCCPTLIVIVGIIIEISTDETNVYRPRYGYGACWLTYKRALLLLFGLPLAILLTVNIILFSLTARSLNKTAQQTKMVNKFSDKVRFFLYVKLAFVLGLTWVFGFVAAFSNVDALWYPFIILIGLQGAIIFFFFTVKRKVYVLLLQQLCPGKRARQPRKWTWFGTSKSTSLSNLNTLQTTLPTPSTPGIRTLMPSLQVKLITT